MSNLPAPSTEAMAHSERLRAAIGDEIRRSAGWISFARFMELVLYAPGLGYYSAGARKFGAAGDFVTSPELTGLFGQALAAQVQQVMMASAPCIIEVGAGSGRLAADLLLELERREALPESYQILDLSADLRQRQRETIAAAAPRLLGRVEWLDTLPECYSGVVVANELLDAMPAHIACWGDGEIMEKGVALGNEGNFVWQSRPAEGLMRVAAVELAEQCSLPPGYESEIGLAARAWAAEWGKRLNKGALLLIDYGFPRHEFYHAQRARGTLMCHYRHHSHPDPFYLPGLQDVTVHVDFTSIIAAAHPAGLDLLGYTNQGQFLINCGILDMLSAIDNTSKEYVRAAGAVNTLLMPHEMGELFKVMALGRGIDEPLLGFRRGDQSHRL
ncbi:class I SAM-dependent methyltransferase [Azonexus sp. IMCC34839]|uniref:class I SAM-dependent methyltransferase n=1 Tax=Azonexus sp. IMCC34839 TaxID=3133695 RepID=UPI0039998DC0